jgi:hypothetical protein
LGIFVAFSVAGAGFADAGATGLAAADLAAAVGLVLLAWLVLSVLLMLLAWLVLLESLLQHPLACKRRHKKQTCHAKSVAWTNRVISPGIYN